MSAKKILNQATIEFNLGNFKKALALFEQVLQLEPLHSNALIKKGNILGKFGKYDDAIESYDKILEIEPQNALALVNKGLALHYLEKYDSAISCYNTILQTNPNNTIALYNKASSLIRQDRIGEGLELLKETIKIDYSYKYKARFDIDFVHLQKNNDFKQIVL